MKVGSDQWLDMEFMLLSDYNSFVVQLLEHCFEFGGDRFYLCEVPDYEEFRENYVRYTQASFRDSRYICETGEEADNYCKGLGSDFGIRYREYLYFRGVRVYTDGNVSGKWTVKTNYVVDMNIMRRMYIRKRSNLETRVLVEKATCDTADFKKFMFVFNLQMYSKLLLESSSGDLQ